jgi:hypothetical protein
MAHLLAPLDAVCSLIYAITGLQKIRALVRDNRPIPLLK